MKVNFIIEKNHTHIIAIVEIATSYIRRNIKESGEKGKEQMIKFIIGLIIGAYTGIGIMCLMVINRGEEDE